MAQSSPDVEAIFFAARQKPAADRAAYLDEACGRDPELRRRVEQFLRAQAEIGSFLEAPAARPVLTIDAPVSEGPGTVIGPYKLLEQIGEGGFGIVFMAEQQQPVRRKVALKVLKPGMDTRQVVARFEAERQALALMDHPHIAHILDGGATASGRPYFVMELVRGVPITAFCDQNHLPVRARLDLFVHVCQAVQHAHTKGVIHRDLKPSNVLVTLHDDRPVVKVIDFGIAKATGQQLTEKTLFTNFAQMVGTPLYMSPEQAQMSGLDIDTRTDIYALGVLLYELLTGTTPFEGARLRQAGYDEIRRIIREEEPAKPSTRISTLGQAAATVSGNRRSDPKQLGQLMRGELDWIVMKALEKDRTRRYETANALARDVERYLADEPVEACPPTTGYKLRKLARKHQKLLTTAAAFVTLLVMGVVASGWQAVRATQAEAVANANAVRAQAKEQEATQQRDEAQQKRDEIRALNEKLQATQARLRSILYTAHVNLAKHAWDEGAISRVLELLEEQRPKPGEPDLRRFEWHYLHRLYYSDLLLTLKGHKDSVENVIFSPDGKRLVSYNGGGTYDTGLRTEPELKVWDVQTGQGLFSLKGGNGCVAWSPDGQRLAATFGSLVHPPGEVKVWDAQTGQELLSLKGHTGGAWSMAFSPDGKRLGSAAFDGMVKVWDAQTGQELLSFPGHTASVSSVVFSPDGKRLATASGGWDKQKKLVRGDVKVWDATTGQELLLLKGHTGFVKSVVFSPDGKRLGSVSYGWDVNQSTSVPRELKVWDAQTGQELLSLKDMGSGCPGIFSPDFKHVAAVVGQWKAPRIKVWDVQTGQEVFTLQGHTAFVESLAFSPDSKHLASGSGDRTILIVDVQRGQQIRTLKGHTSYWSVAFSPDGKRLASGGDGGTVAVWNAQKDSDTLTLQGSRVAFSPDFRRLASATADKTVRVWDAQTGQEIRALKGHTGSVCSMAFSPDGKRLASVDLGPVPYHEARVPFVVKVWDEQNGQELLSLQGQTGAKDWRRPSVAFSPDGKRLACAGGGEGKVWDAQTGQELLTFKGGGFSVAFSPDGKRLASPAWETVKVWDAQTGQELFTLQGGGSVAFSPDGKRLASDEKVWDAQTGKELLSLKGHASSVYSVVFSPDGTRLAGVSEDNTVTVWDAQTGQETLALKGPADVVKVAFSPDGHRLACASDDGTVKFYDATPLPEAGAK
jgi:WD40 repeat protein/serine/threonine protein kinase